MSGDLAAWAPTLTAIVLVGGLVWRLSATLTHLERELRGLRGRYEALAQELQGLRELLVLALRSPNG
jgi:hypothetical protein